MEVGNEFKFSHQLTSYTTLDKHYNSLGLRFLIYEMEMIILHCRVEKIGNRKKV